LVPLETAVEIDAATLSTRELNAVLKNLAAKGTQALTISNPDARHNLAVGILDPVKIRIAGSAGYYCAGLMDGPSIEIDGSAGWGLAESMLSGCVTVHGSAGNGAAAAMRGGTVVILGDAAARLGVSMKGGLVIVTGNCGYMAGFMAQKGTMIVCGDTGKAFADSMYAATCYVGGSVGDLGTDAVEEGLEEEDVRFLETALQEHLSPHLHKSIPDPLRFTKIVAGRKLWKFDKKDWTMWQEAL
jgi:methylamine---glutamate N-methyltransferase subunit B